MQKTIPISLGVIALSVAVIAGAAIYDRVTIHNQQQAAQARLTALAQQNALKQCRQKLAALSASLVQKQSDAAPYAPDPKIENPETLNDVQSILYKNLLTDISTLTADITLLNKQCALP